jgi:hypothetical protein
VSLSLLESEIRGGILLLDRCSNGQGGIDGAGADRLPSMALRIMLLLPAGGGGCRARVASLANACGGGYHLGRRCGEYRFAWSEEWADRDGTGHKRGRSIEC